MFSNNRIFRLTFVSLAGFLLSSFSPLYPSELVYTKADLEILQSQKSFNEFFKHAKDIVPTARDKSWYEMVSDMGTGYLDHLRKSENFKKAHFKSVQHLSTWPELKRDEFFQVKREAYTLSYLNHCFAHLNPKECHDDLQSFWRSSRKEGETGYQLMLLKLGFFPKSDGFPYIEKLLVSDNAQFYCDKPIVQRVFLKHLKNQNLNIGLDQNSEKRLQVKTSHLAQSSCWDKMIPFLKTTLNNENDPQLYIILHHLKALNPVENGYWLTQYFLQNTDEGPILNLAWRNLEELAQNYALRGKIYQKLTAQDPLPGKVFAHPNDMKRKVFTTHFSKTFPEYINHYSKKCVGYLSGDEVFPRGNPTMECHSLFATDEQKEQVSEKIISQEIHFKYSSVMKKTNP